MIEPSTPEIAEPVLLDLRRLAATRWPDAATIAEGAGEDPGQGPSLERISASCRNCGARSTQCGAIIPPIFNA